MVLHADETTLQVLKEPGRSSTSKSYMWLYRTNGCAKQAIVLYEYQPTRKAEHAERFLQGFSGWLHADGYQGYHRLPGNIRVVGCWAHARRKFDEALGTLPQEKRKDSPAVTAVGALGTKAVQAYADYEQLVGGVETLFKDSQDEVMEYANNAYKTAGLSANEYMETVTSFSASLLQSLDGDTSAAAEKANLALTDMSDNANKMGSSMESKNQDALPFVHFIKGRASVFDLKTMLQTVGYCAAHGGYGWTELDGA